MIENNSSNPDSIGKVKRIFNGYRPFSMTDDSKFAIVSPKSVKLYAEIVGAQGLTDDLASSLAEDVTYRLRETLQASLITTGFLC